MRLDHPKHYEPFASARRDIAGLLRKVHSDNPAMARLLNRRMKEAEKIMVDRVFNSPTGGVGGLAALLSD